jgi:hypothetical protein
VSKPFEKVIATYGYWPCTQGIFMTKGAAQKFAEQMIDATVDGSPLVPSKQFRVISTRMDDDPADSSKGCVIAICQEIQRTSPQGSGSIGG